MGNLGWAEIMIVLVIALIVFGPRKLPELGKTLGQSLAQFRRASEDFKRTWEAEVETEKHRLDVYRPPEPLLENNGDQEVQPLSNEAAGDGSATESSGETADGHFASTTESVEAAQAEGVVAALESGPAKTKLDWA